jgi:hypothetical protein
MKIQVVNPVPPPPPQLTADKVSVSRLYGVQIYDRRGFITRQNYHDGKFVARCQDELTRGNGWDSYDSVTLTDLIARIIKDKDNKVFQFDTPKELFAWMIE